MTLYVIIILKRTIFMLSTKYTWIFFQLLLKYIKLKKPDDAIKFHPLYEPQKLSLVLFISHQKNREKHYRCATRGILMTRDVKDTLIEYNGSHAINATNLMPHNTIILGRGGGGLRDSTFHTHIHRGFSRLHAYICIYNPACAFQFRFGDFCARFPFFPPLFLFFAIHVFHSFLYRLFFSLSRDCEQGEHERSTHTHTHSPRERRKKARTMD